MSSFFTKIKKVILIFLLSFLLPLKSAIFIFDLDGVLSYASRIKSAWHVGFIRLFGFYNFLRLSDAVLDFLDQLMLHQSNDPILMYNGRRLPAIMVAWLRGTITQEEIAHLVEIHFSKLLSACDSQRKAWAIKETALLIFNPYKFSKTIQPSEEGVKLLKKLYRAKNADGSKKHRIFILTNWDSRSFRLLAQREEFADFFDMCDGILVSADVGLVKPQPEIFNYLFKLFAINPDRELTIYIDDNSDNIAAAQALNRPLLRPLLCTNFNFKPIKKKLHELEVL